MPNHLPLWVKYQVDDGVKPAMLSLSWESADPAYFVQEADLDVKIRAPGPGGICLNLRP